MITLERLKEVLPMTHTRASLLERICAVVATARGGTTTPDKGGITKIVLQRRKRPSLPLKRFAQTLYFCLFQNSVYRPFRQASPIRDGSEVPFKEKCTCKVYHVLIQQISRYRICRTVNF
jgi:hypothetical protein